VTFARGYAEQLDALVGDLLASDGAVAGRTQGIDASIKDIAGRRATLERRMVAIEARLRAQFVALDTMISSMNQTSAYLTQQLANLPGSSTKE
jgi:flagellar hook-associated protein 2